MARSAALLASLALVAAPAALARPHASVTARAVPASQATFVISGRGWGHGVGMSQWGAYGFAAHGWTYDRIVAHYYPGTQLGAAPVPRVRVLLRDGRRTLRISSAVPFAVRDGAGVRMPLAPKAYAFGPGLRVLAGKEPLAGPLLFLPGSEPLLVDGKPYRGQLEVSVVGGKLRVVDVVGLEAYLAGVVPDEVPSDWPPEALKAQAVVARSYALASRRSGPFDLFADVRSQVYGGVAAEEPETTTAIGETAGQVVLYEGKVAQTFFFSTSGGRTASAGDTWSGEAVPYLVSVEDPYDDASPHHTWGPFAFTAATLAKKLGAKGRVLDVRTEVNASQRVNAVTVVGDRGEKRLTGGEVRTRLGLRSTWFRVGTMVLARPAKPIPFGATATLTGTVRGITASLEARPAGGAWVVVGAVKGGAGGALATAVKPTVATEYRLAAGKVRTAPVRVLVAPRVRLVPPTGPGVLGGIVRPVLPGTTVAVQRRGEDGAWSEVAVARVDERGAFRAELALAPGTYRARFAPGRGLAVGISPILEVRPA
ncbi:MAG TPA: SpoIID/LytB domain-containing protein [Gaiellaceae bacterium]|nr:SpoIID/LytB domain-containing protein [Gaiellaceae bacterium]